MAPYQARPHTSDDTWSALFMALLFTSTQVSRGEKHCTVTFRDGFDCSAFTPMESSMEVKHWPWQERHCKLRDHKGRANPDACLWQGCVEEQNLTKGAIDLVKGLDFRGIQGNRLYCKKEHCSNNEFDLETTTVEDANAYCDRKFGNLWQHQKVGRGGYGPPWPGTGVWECALSNYHCDWAYCKLFFCDDSKYDSLLKEHAGPQGYGLQPQEAERSCAKRNMARM